MNNLPDLQKLSDVELKAFINHLQETTLKALDVIGAEIDAGRINLDIGAKEGDRIAQHCFDQQQLCIEEQSRRRLAATRKLRIVMFVSFAALGLILLSLVLFK